MADNQSMIAGLFATPEMYQQQQNDLATQQAIQMAQLTPEQRAQADIRGGFQRAGNAVGGLMGAQDPQMKIVAIRNQLAQGKDLTTSEGWGSYAKDLQTQGDLQGAAAAAQRATELQAKIDEKQADRASREAIAAQRTASAESIAQQKADNAMAIARMEAAMKGTQSGLQQQIMQEKLDALREKRTALDEAQQTKLNSSISTADNIISVAKEALPLVKGSTTGTFGQVTGLKAGSDAYKLQSKIDTIKAQLGFAQLQQMRDSSPTGGALGQVAVQELNYLQAALTNLDRSVGDVELKSNLEKVIKHYTAWRDAATAKQAAKANPSAGGGNDPLGIRK